MRNLFLYVNKFMKFFRLPWREKLLLIETFMLTGIIRFAILFVPFKKLAEIAGRYNEESSKEITDEEKIIAGRISRAVYIASKFTPWESKCLVRALTAQILLSERKVSSTLFLGVAKGVENSLEAHAWLRCGENIITGETESKRFKQVAKFANNPKGG